MPYSPRDSQESSSAPQIERINASALSLTYFFPISFMSSLVFLKIQFNTTSFMKTLDQYSLICETSNSHRFPIHSTQVQFSSVTQSCPTFRNPMNCSTPGLTVHHHSQRLLKLTSIESVMPSSHLILGHHLLLLPPIPPSIRDFCNESTLRGRCKNPNYWSFSFSTSPSKTHPGLISFRMDR